MSKKRKRKTQPSNEVGRRNSSGVKTSSRNLPDGFNPDYTYVRKDLRTIGILASIFITILVVLSIFI
jgi:hypothetical protein